MLYKDLLHSQPLVPCFNADGFKNTAYCCTVPKYGNFRGNVGILQDKIAHENHHPT
jgi:hypothetical protein